MDFANPSWISLWRGTGWDFLVAGFVYQIMAPAMTNQDAAEILKLADEFATLHSASFCNDQVFHFPDVGQLA